METNKCWTTTEIEICLDWVNKARTDIKDNNIDIEDDDDICILYYIVCEILSKIEETLGYPKGNEELILKMLGYNDKEIERYFCNK